MVEENNFEFLSSQESLPLSQESLLFTQETFDHIWHDVARSVVTADHNAVNIENLMTDSEIQSIFASDIEIQSLLPSGSGVQTTTNGIKVEVEQIASVSVPIHVQQEISSSSLDIQHAPSSLPASQTWPGEYGFNVSFNPQEKNTKGIAWTYSKIVDKLYVGKDAPCPINFSANALLPDGMLIRVMALYTSPEQVSEVVKRCVNHSMQEIAGGFIEAEHLVRCESSMATYHENASTGRHSVTVPFENPPVGQQFSTYIYKFACFGSCSGGPNRRPLMLIFTLERGNQVIGRKKLDVKICACPGRDRKTEEAQKLESDAPRGSKKRKEPSVDLGSVSDSVPYRPTKKPKSTPGKDGYYTLHVEEKECYDFLLQMKKYFEIRKIVDDLSPDMTKALLYYQKKKNGDKSE